ncbi:MAG: hypothetical protein HC912_00010 [Saprospiraceae bacterium]|nr:hypothetical protein [Saprospiraceae bacterium]
MRKKIFAFLLSVSLLLGIGMMPLSVNAQSDETITIDVDTDPDKSGRVFGDVTAETPIGSIRFVGCSGTGGDCLATIVING